jgi:hypothetical protein
MTILSPECLMLRGARMAAFAQPRKEMLLPNNAEAASLAILEYGDYFI